MPLAAVGVNKGNPMKLLCRSLMVLAVTLTAASAPAADWAYQGGDAGMTKYSADNVSADGVFQQLYAKRFYSKYSEISNHTYNYATSVLIRGGQAWVLSNDGPDDGNSYSLIVNTKFDWLTGATTMHSYMPGFTTSNHSFHAGEASGEIDSHHTNFPAVWAADGRIYARRGGDHAVNGAMDATTGTWTLLPYGGAATNGWYGDSAAFINVYGNNLLYYGGDTRDPWNYAAANISSAAWAAGTQGGLRCPVNIDSPYYTSGDHYAGFRHGDVPKAGSNMAVVASWSGSNAPYTMYVTATNLVTGQKAWTRNFANDRVGATGFYTSTSDYWRFLATEDGKYAFFVRNGSQTQLHIANIATGSDNISPMALAANSDPIMAYNQDWLYVVSAHQQMKINATTGAIAWQTTNSFSSDAGYYANYVDPLYRPMVLTNDTMWFVDGSTLGTGLGNGHLIGMRTSDGAIVQNIDLEALVTGKNANERLLSVNDLVESNGKLGVLLDIADVTDIHYISTNKIKYQDLYVFGSLSSPLAGDADGNGIVDFRDYIILEADFGKSGMNFAHVDFNSDSVVDFKDYIILEGNFGKTSVPEPTTMGLLVAGGLALRRCRV